MSIQWQVLLHQWDRASRAIRFGGTGSCNNSSGSIIFKGLWWRLAKHDVSICRLRVLLHLVVLLLQRDPPLSENHMIETKDKQSKLSLERSISKELNERHFFDSKHYHIVVLMLRLPRQMLKMISRNEWRHREYMHVSSEEIF